MDRNTTGSCVNTFTFGGFPMAVISVPVGVILVTQNLLSIIIIRRSPKLHTHANILTASVALADIYLSLFLIIGSIFYLPDMTNSSWNTAVLDTSLCGAAYSSLLMSVIQLGFIAIDRYICIVHPLYYMAHVTKRRVYTMIACVWFVALVYACIPVFVYRNTTHSKNCILINPPVEYIYVPGLLYHIEIILIFACYFRIARLAFQRKKASHARQLGLQQGISNRETISTSRTAVWRSVKFFATMCGIFVVCTYPSCLAIAINSMNSLSKYVFMPLMFLFCIHSTFNFFIYLRMNNDFSQAFKRLILDMQHVCLKENSASGLYN